MLPEHQIPFPMAGHCPIRRLGGPVGDHDHVLEAAGADGPTVGPALGPSGDGEAAGDLFPLFEGQPTVGAGLPVIGPAANRNSPPNRAYIPVEVH